MGVVELVIHSAQQLKDVKRIGACMQPYVVASIESSTLTYSQNENSQKARTPPDKTGGCNPTWEYPLTLSFSFRHLSDIFNKTFLLLQVLSPPSSSSIISSSPTHVGSTLIPFSLIASRLDPSTAQPLCFSGQWQRSTSRIQRLSGRYQGFITFSVRIRAHDNMPPPVVSCPRRELADSTHHIHPSSTPTDFSSHAQSSGYDTNSGDNIASAFVVGTLAAEAWEMADFF